jgi:hypothetical protein
VKAQRPKKEKYITLGRVPEDLIRTQQLTIVHRSAFFALLNPRIITQNRKVGRCVRAKECCVIPQHKKVRIAQKKETYLKLFRALYYFCPLPRKVRGIGDPPVPQLGLILKL